MRIGVGAPRGSTETGVAGMINLLKADPWLSNRPDGRVTDRIASDWSWDPGGTALRLTLRKDVYFHDGTLMTPDLAATILRTTVTDPRSLASFKSIQTIRVESDGLVLELKERNDFLPSDLAGTLVVMPGDGKEDIGTGPFQVVARQGRDASLSAFPRYYRGQPPLAGIDVKNYPTQRNAWAAMMRGEIDMLYEVSRDAVDFVETETTVKTYKFSRPYYIPLVFNVRRPALKDPRVRQAINEALDRQALVQDGMSGRGSVADGPIFPKHWAYSPPSVPFAFDPASARRRLDAAGYPARTSASNPMPVRFSFDCLLFASDSRFERIAVLAQKQLADVGIDMRLVPVTLVQLAQRAAAGEFDAIIHEFAGRSLSWVHIWWRTHPGMLTDSGYRAADAVLDRMKAARTDAETRAAVAELMRVLHDDPPAAFLAWQEQTRAVSTKFDVSPEPDRDILTNLWFWRPADAARQASR